jgi:predicted DNA-binding protein (UPF0251 family)
MPRPRRLRRIKFMPETVHFKPAGAPLANLQEKVLTVEEYEAVRLKDLENLEQTKAAKKMKISQSTFNRVLSSARKKLADAIINGKSIKIQGGNFEMVQPRGRGLGLGRGRGMGQGLGRQGGTAQGPGGKCKCPKCGYEEEHSIGTPCYQKKCPKCKTPMTRG